MMMNNSITVFMPAYNEEENIVGVVKRIDSYLSARFRDYEILVIDDGSKDATASIIGKLSREITNLKLISHPVNKGYGHALRSGFLNASKDLFFYTDSDGQFDIQELDKFFPLLTEYDIITGFRRERRDPPTRIWMGRIYNFFYKNIYKLPVRDIDCAFKLFKKEVFDNFHFDPSIRTGIINAEIYIKARRGGYKITELGVTHYPRLHGISSNEVEGQGGKVILFIKPHVLWDFLRDTLSLWIDLQKQK